MDFKEVMQALEEQGNENTKRILKKHGAREPFFGVKIEFLKKLQKKIKKDHTLSLALYDTGNSDAMYLAGLIADETQITKADLKRWIKDAYWYLLSEGSVASVAAETAFGESLAKQWIQSKEEQMAAAGWAILSNIISVRSNETLNYEEIEAKLDIIPGTIHQSKDRVRYSMNNFVICVGGYIPELTSKAMETAYKMGLIEVNMGDTACKVPDAAGYINKMKSQNKIGKKRKRIR